MQRTQISLTDADRRALDAVADRTGRSLSSLIRAAVQAQYATGRSVEEDLAAMRGAFGAWTERDGGDGDLDGGGSSDREGDGRTDCRDGRAWVDQLRTGTRIEHRR